MVKTESKRRLVQIGRYALKVNGLGAGSVGTIVNIIDQNRVLIDGAGAASGLKRQVANLKDLEITPFAQPLLINASSKVVAKATAESKIDAEWNASEWAQKLAVRAAKRDLTDFGRFQLARAKRQRNFLVRNAFFALKKQERGGKPVKAVKASKAKTEARALKTKARLARRVKDAKRLHGVKVAVTA